MPRGTRLHDAIDRLAALYDGGHLMADTGPATLIGLVCDEIERLRAELASVVLSHGTAFMCAACGQFADLSEAEKEMARKADRAWDREVARQEREAGRAEEAERKEALLREAVAARKRGG